MKYLNDIYSNTFYFWLIIYIYIFVYIYIYILYVLYIYIYRYIYIYIYTKKNKLSAYENRSGSSNLLSNTVKKYISVCLFMILI